MGPTSCGRVVAALFAGLLSARADAQAIGAAGQDALENARSIDAATPFQVRPGAASRIENPRIGCEARQTVGVTFTPCPEGGAAWRMAAAAQGCAAHRDRFAALIGRSEPEARAALATMGGIATIRSGGPGMPMSRDYRPDRATIVVERDVVTSIGCG